MLNSLDKDSSLYQYLISECGWLLEPLKGSFTIKVLNLSKAKLIVSNRNYLLHSNQADNHPRKFAGISGTYLFTNLITNQQYIGSSIDLYNRYKSHIINSIRPHRGGNTPLYNSINLHKLKHFTWSPIVTSTNHINTFFENKLTLKKNFSYKAILQEIYILRSFTQFEARIYEQSLIKEILPSLNNSLEVTFPFLNWKEGDTGLTSNDESDRYLIVIAKDKSFSISFSSTNAAVRTLGIPKTTLNRYVNYINISLKSPTLGKDIYIINNKKPLLEGKPDFPKTSHESISDIDLYNLESGKLYAYLMDKITILGTYKSPNEAAYLLDGKKDSKYISRYINLEHPVIVSPDRIPVYFTMHPYWKNNKSGRIGYRWNKTKSSKSKSIVLVDTLEKTAIQYDTVSELLEVLGLNKSFTSFVKRYMNPTKLYKKIYEFYYTEDFKGELTR
uniref:GIY-YIG domain-containing protein n=1 Tax=Mutinus fleischeri TaxID=2218478 RepID=A0A8K1REZ4_9AGAM|nr:hypothetical protein [Mutinus fleischeri]